jgi:hypothetical protein
MDKETPCAATFISNKQKYIFVFFSLFPSTKLENRKAKQVLPGERTETSGKEEVLEKGGGG